jgi:aconitate hydratase
MSQTLTEKLIGSHLVEGALEPGSEVGIRVDQVLVNDASGPLVILELEAMDLERVAVDPAVAYMDHLVVQADNRNADDHMFMRSGAQRFGLWFSPTGNGVAHPVHQQRFGLPGATLLGGDSHTPAAGSMGMLAIGAGGLAIARALAGEPFYLKMPEVWGVRLEGQLPDWVSAKDVILELLRRHGVDGGAGRIIEYHGLGLAGLTCMDRHVIANMGTELGATTSVFPSDGAARHFLELNGRSEDWQPLAADSDATYDNDDVVDLSSLEPLIAMPSSPGNVRRVRDVGGEPIQQAYIGSSANPGYRDIAVVAEIVRGQVVADGVSLDINPASRQALSSLIADRRLLALVTAGARIHQTGCNGCIGMGQAPATDVYSLRTVPRNFPGRSGTPEDKVCLVSPETAAVSALAGVITDPRTLDQPYPRIDEPQPVEEPARLEPPLAPDAAIRVQLRKGPNITGLPPFDPLPANIEATVLLKMGDDVSTDEIMPAGADQMSDWSNVGAMGDIAFSRIDGDYSDKARSLGGAHAVVGGRNYGQGSSREHAVVAPRALGLRLVLAGSIARIHWENLVNFGVLPLMFADGSGYEAVSERDVLCIADVENQLRAGDTVEVENVTTSTTVPTTYGLSGRQVDVILRGGIIATLRQRQSADVQRDVDART